MKSKLLKLCIAGSLFLVTSCNSNADDKKKDGADTAAGAAEKVTTSDLPANDPSPVPVTNKSEYSYDVSVVISGKISKETFYGSPGFGENPQTDEKEERYLLVLDKPINVIGDTNPEDDSKESKFNVSKIQLLYDEKTIDMGRYLGSAVQLTGTLFGAHTGHHHTPVLMDVTQVSR